MNTNEMDHLISIIHKNDIEFTEKDRDVILNSLVYYIPRTKDRNALKNAVQQIFSMSNPSLVNDPFNLQEVIQSMFQWKLSISEPTITLTQFYNVWDSLITNPTQKWSVIQLSILSGVLLTEPSYRNIQTKFFSDDSKDTIKLYSKWRYSYFIPILNQIMNSVRSDTTLFNSDTIDILVSLFSTVNADTLSYGNNNDHLNLLNIHCDLMTESSINIIVKYITHSSEYPHFLDKKINCIALNLQNCIPFSDPRTLCKSLNRFDQQCVKLAKKEENSVMPNKTFSGQYYSNILMSMVLTFKTILGTIDSQYGDKLTRQNEETCRIILHSLFNLNFIALDFGLVGFQSYEIVYAMICQYLTKMNNKNLSLNIYIQILTSMIRDINTDLKYPNKINDSRIIFLLNFLENTLPLIHHLTLKRILQDIIVVSIIKLGILENKCPDVKEAAHSVMIVILTLTTNDRWIQEWQLSRMLPYMKNSISQYIDGELSSAQLHIISQKLGSSVKVLSMRNHDFQREWLHGLYRSLIDLGNPKNNSRVIIQQRTTLVKNIIFQIPYVDDKYLLDWLENIQEFLQTMLFDDCNYRDLRGTLWDVISRSKSDIAIKWWYYNRNSNMRQPLL